MASQCMEYIGAIEEFKHFAGTFIAKAFPAVRVDMVHEQGDILLRQAIKGSSFGEDIAYEFMILLGRAFLTWRRCIAVKNTCPQISPAGHIQLPWDLKIRSRYR